MNVQKVEFKPSFGIKVDPQFLKVAQNYYHYGNVPNKRHLIWSFNQKAEEYLNYGYQDYTLSYVRKLINGNWQHYLVATNDSNANKKVIIVKRENLAKIIRRFMGITQGAFRGMMKSNIG